jgi:hypothetical protein
MAAKYDREAADKFWADEHSHNQWEDKFKDILVLKGSHSPILHIQSIQFGWAAPSKEALCMTTLSASKPFPMLRENVLNDKNLCHWCGNGFINLFHQHLNQVAAMKFMENLKESK